MVAGAKEWQTAWEATSSIDYHGAMDPGPSGSSAGHRYSLCRRQSSESISERLFTSPVFPVFLSSP
jgi:hypothetical protein